MRPGNALALSGPQPRAEVLLTTRQSLGLGEMSQYFDLRGFEAVYLEDSFVLGVTATPGLLVVDLDVVLTEDHPSYTPPPPEEHYCYRRG